MIRKAEIWDAGKLTEISFASKAYWNYPKEYFSIWKDELTITSKYILENDVFVYEADATPIGFYSTVSLENDIFVSGIKIESGIWLDHMFIMPSEIGKGIGTMMCSHLVSQCQTNSVELIKVLADPHAKGFYEKMDFRFIKDYPSTIPGRTTPYLELFLI